MIKAPDKGIVVAVVVASTMHLLLFAAVRPRNGGPADVPVPPETSYMFPDPLEAEPNAISVRTLWSPVLFSLPSRMGFSSELQDREERMRLSFSRPAMVECFFEVDPSSLVSDASIDRQKLMLTASTGGAPLPPADLFQSPGKRPSAPRASLSPGLRERLVGGIVLPPGLNRPAATPWEVHATVRVAADGVVQHVFIDKPLESAALNQQVLRLLYSLRFKSGEPVEGFVEIYSPEPVAMEGTP